MNAPICCDEPGEVEPPCKECSWMALRIKELEIELAATRCAYCHKTLPTRAYRSWCNVTCFTADERSQELGW